MISSVVSKSTQTVNAPFNSVFRLLVLLLNANLKFVSLYYVTKSNVAMSVTLSIHHR